MPTADERGLDAPLIMSTDENDDGADRSDPDRPPRLEQTHEGEHRLDHVEGVGSLEITGPTKLFALCAALNSCNLGYDIGVNTGAAPLLQRTLGLSDLQVEIFVGSMNLFAMAGSISSNWISDRLGRRMAFRAAAIAFILGVVLQSAARGYTTLMFGRVFVGLGVGFGLAVDPVYISEISQAAHRGQLVTWSEIGINVGLVFGFSSGLIFSGVDGDVAWRLMFAMGLIMPCLVIYCSTYVMPESPRWLVSKARDDEAREVLKMVYPEGYDVGAIAREIKDGIEKESIAQRTVGWNVILFPSPAFRRMLLVGVGVALSQQAVGIDAIQSFLVYIMVESGITSRRRQAGILIGLGAIKLGMILLAGCLFDRRGRRPLFFASLLGMSASLLVVSFGFLGTVQSEALAVVGLALYLAFFSLGVGPGAWLVPSEVFSTLIRAKAMSLATFANRAAATVMSSTFLTVADAMSWSGFFVMMAVVCLVVLAWVHAYLPETRGRPLEEMSRFFAEITGDRSVLEAERTLRGGDGRAPGTGGETSARTPEGTMA